MQTQALPALLLLALITPISGCDDSGSPQEGGDSTGGTTDAQATDAGGNESTTPSTDPTTGPTGTPTTDDTSTTGPTSDSDDETAETTATSETTDSSETEGETTGATDCEDTVPCEDEMILDLGLVSGTVSAGEIGNTADGDGWVTTVDATAGGIVDAPNNPWTYLRFTEGGLEKVELDDLQALTSTQWHIAAKRFGVRLNSGASGPGCVSVATLDGDYADVDALPEDATLHTEAFYDNSCTVIDDGSGAGGVNFALTPWWFYPGCVGVTYTPFVLELEDGQHVKFVIDSYYESGQAACNETGAMGSGSANFTWRWSFLDA